MNTNKHVLNRYFDNIYVLYITEFELDRIKYKLINKRISAQYYKGVDGQKELTKQFADYVNFHNDIQSRHFIKTPGAFGHIYSFIKILTDAINNNYKKILILEPDIYFDKNFDHLVEKYLVRDYKLLYLGASQHLWKPIDDNYSHLLKQGYYYANNTCGTYALGIDKTIFEEYLDKLKELKDPSDVCIFDLQGKYREESIVAFPNIITCDVSKSTTTNRRRSQLEIGNKFRWNENYIINEKFSYRVNINSIYKIVIEINYHNPKKKAWFAFKDDHDDLTPVFYLSNKTICEKKYKKIDNMNIQIETYYIYLKPKVNKIYLYLENFHIDNVYFFEFVNDKNKTNESLKLIKSKISKFLLNSNDKNILKYYQDFSNELKL